MQTAACNECAPSQWQLQASEICCRKLAYYRAHAPMLWCQEYVQLNIFQMLRNDLKYTNLQVVLHMHHRTVRASSTQFAGATIYKHQ